MEHIVRFEEGHDCLRFTCRWDSAQCRPGAGGSHGVSGLVIRFVSKGDAGAVQFALSTGWLPQYTEPSSIGTRWIESWGGAAMPYDLGYHSKAIRYEGQAIIDDACEWCDGQPCYYDGSGLNAYDAMYTLVNGGEVALWAFLDAYYESVFKDGPYPQPAEYVRPLRQDQGEEG